MSIKKVLRNKIVFLAAILLVLPSLVAADSAGETRDFFIDPNYDLSQREEVSATLQRNGQDAYFYLGDEWWDALEFSEKQEVKNALRSLDYEFLLKSIQF